MRSNIKLILLLLFFCALILTNFYFLIKLQVSFSDGPLFYSIFEIIDLYNSNGHSKNIDITSAYLNIKLAFFAGMLFAGLILAVANIIFTALKEFIITKK